LHDFWQDILIKDVGLAIGQHGLLDAVVTRHDDKTTIHVISESV
jgi:hypothetical protein